MAPDTTQGAPRRAAPAVLARERGADGRPRLVPRGDWTAPHAALLNRLGQAAEAEAPGAGIVDLRAVERLDSAGAWIVLRTARALKADIVGIADRHAPLLKLVEDAAPTERLGERPGAIGPVRVLNAWGAAVFDAGNEARSLVNFLGLVTLSALSVLMQPRRMRWKSTVTQMEQAGLNAVPIVGLLAFLIGVVLAYQSADQLRQFGAEIFTVNLLAISVLRVLGVLITAIVIAGRSGSAYTAEIGSMQVREEVDAMRALGLNPVEVLVLPRIIALVIVLPLLAFYANVMALIGGAAMVTLTLHISPVQFLVQLNEAIVLNTLLVGLIQAPVFAFLIALVGCFEGLRVERSAESVGRQTTRSVVEAIFLVIVATALFSVLFSVLGI